MKWTQFLLVGTISGLAMFSPLAATSEAQACLFPCRPFLCRSFPCRPRLFCRGPVVCNPVVEMVCPPAVFVPPEPVHVSAPFTKVNVFTPQALVDVQTPFASVQVQRPLIRSYTVLYRHNPSASWQQFGSFHIYLRAQKAAAGLAAKGLETNIR